MDYINETVKNKYEEKLQDTKSKLQQILAYIEKLENEKGKSKHWGDLGSLEHMQTQITEATENILN